MTITENCLIIKFSAGGCDGNTWAVKLIDMGIMAKSYPGQRTLKLSFDNKKMCEAYIIKKYLLILKIYRLKEMK